MAAMLGAQLGKRNPHRRHPRRPDSWRSVPAGNGEPSRSDDRVVALAIMTAETKSRRKLPRREAGADGREWLASQPLPASVSSTVRHRRTRSIPDSAPAQRSC